MPMDSDKINSLLDKYWACETTLDEEKELREYFEQGEFPEQLRETSHLFRYFSETRSNAISDVSFDRQVIDRISAGKQGKVRRLLFNTMRIAAGVAVLVVATFLVRNEIRNNNPEDVADTYSDPKIAFEETKKALMMISKSFGTAEEEAKKINLFNEAQEVVRKKDENSSTNL